MVVSFSRIFLFSLSGVYWNWNRQFFISVRVLFPNMPRFFSDKSEKVPNTMGNFKQRKSLATRKEEVENIRSKFPTKIPVIVERFPKETQLPVLDKTKFLVPQELAISQFLTIIRSRMRLGPNQAFYLLINNKNLASMSKTIAEVYLENKDEDGFLYVTYASQEMFGHSSEKVFVQVCV